MCIVVKVYLTNIFMKENVCLYLYALLSALQTGQLL